MPADVKPPNSMSSWRCASPGTIAGIAAAALESGRPFIADMIDSLSACGSACVCDTDQFDGAILAHFGNMAFRFVHEQQHDEAEHGAARDKEEEGVVIDKRQHRQIHHRAD